MSDVVKKTFSFEIRQSLQQIEISVFSLRVNQLQCEHAFWE